MVVVDQAGERRVNIVISTSRGLQLQIWRRIDRPSAGGGSPTSLCCQLSPGRHGVAMFSELCRETLRRAVVYNEGMWGRPVCVIVQVEMCRLLCSVPRNTRDGIRLPVISIWFHATCFSAGCFVYSYLHKHTWSKLGAIFSIFAINNIIELGFVDFTLVWF